MRHAFVLAFLALGLLLGVSGLATASDANGNHATYIWVVGATTPSDTAIAPNGSTITMSGFGTLTAGPGNTAGGGGSYSLSGGGSGTWNVTGIQGFVSYGTPDGEVFGGEAKLNVELTNGASGVLTIYCLLGSPPAGKKEGISVVLSNGGQFTKPVEESGNTVFILF